MEQITDFNQLSPGDVVAIQGNGLDERGEFVDRQESEWGMNDNPIGFVQTEDTTLTVQETMDRKLQTDEDLFSIGGVGKAKLFRE